MSQSNQSRAVTILMEALDQPESDRAAFVQRACGGNEALLAEVQSLLDSDARAGDFLGSPTAGAPPATQDMTNGPLREGPGTTIGPYKLLHLIGEGGFGSVFMAEQEKPVRRKVALKIIKLGMDTRQVVARFEAERQALAIMDHPNIARVLEAGATQSGRPYFVMELVRGVPITDYCDTNNLPLPERLALFVQVCRAVQHAHSKGIIHRDLKPSNVMVTMADGRPAPKVIDFGIAKATDQRLAEKTVFTELRQMIGTPEYMSPEQAEMAGIDIDTRSDVYSLGVLLYELLVGSTPFDPRELRSKAYAEMQRIIREVDPERPSTRLSKLEMLASVAARRRIEPAKLGQLLKGELDWIVMRAMEKDRTRRYETASALARDVERYLDDEAVEACPPSTGYRLRRLARKYRRTLRVVAAVAAMLLAATAFSSWEAVHARRAQAIAVTAENNAKKDRDQALLDKRRADEQSAIARAINDFLDQDVLGKANPFNQGGAPGEAGFGAAPNPDLKVREALDNAAARIAGRFKGQPRIELEIRRTIGDAYRMIGQYDKAAAQLQAAVVLAHPFGDTDPQTLNSLEALGLLSNEEGRYGEAEALETKALEGQRKILGADHPNTLNSMHNLAVVYENMGRYPEAEALQKQALDSRRRTLGDANPDTLHSLAALAGLYANLHRDTEAEPLLKRAIEGQRKAIGEEHPYTLLTLSILAQVYVDEARYKEAESLSKQVVERCRKSLGDAHPATLRALLDVAGIYSDEGRYSQAESLYKQTRDVLRRTFDESSPTMLEFLYNFARLYEQQGRYADAEAMCKQVLSGQQKTFGNAHLKTLSSLQLLSVIYDDEGRFPESELLCKEASEGYRQLLGSEHPATLDCLINLAGTYTGDGRYSDAESMFKRLLIALRRVRGDSHPSTLGCLGNLADVYRKEGRPSDAEPLYKQVLDGFRRTLGDAHPITLSTLSELAMTYRDEARYSEAEALFQQAVKESRSKLGEMHPDTLGYMAALAFLYRDQGRYAEAEALCEETLKRRRATLGPNHFYTLDSLALLADLYARRNRYAEAEPMLKQVLEARRALLGDANPWTLSAMRDLANLYLGQERDAEAETLYRQALEGRRKCLGETNPETLLSLSELGHCYLAQRRFAEAEPMLKQALEGFRKIPGAIRPQTKYCVDDLAVVYVWQQRFADAEPLFKEAMELFGKSLGAGHRDTLMCLYHYAMSRAMEGRLPEAESMCKQSLNGRRKALGDANSDTLNSVLLLALIYRGESRFSDANPLFRELLDGRRKTVGNAQPVTLAALALLVQNDRQIGREPEAESLFNEWAETTVANDTSKLATKGLAPAEASKAFNERGLTLTRLGRFRAGETDFAQALALDATDHWPWYYRGCLLAYLKDEDAYRSHCKAMLEKFGGSEDKNILERTAKTCLLLPAAGDPKQLLAMAERALPQAGEDKDLRAWFDLCKSLALYRAGDFANCVEWAEKCKVADTGFPPRAASADLLMAMSQERSDHHDDAVASLKRAVAIIDTLPKAGTQDIEAGGLENWLICQTLLREAREVVHADAPTTLPVAH